MNALGSKAQSTHFGTIQANYINTWLDLKQSPKANDGASAGAWALLQAH